MALCPNEYSNLLNINVNYELYLLKKEKKATSWECEFWSGALS